MSAVAARMCWEKKAAEENSNIKQTQSLFHFSIWLIIFDYLIGGTKFLEQKTLGLVVPRSFGVFFFLLLLLKPFQQIQSWPNAASSPG